jgi:hypothetical protein
MGRKCRIRHDMEIRRQMRELVRTNNAVLISFIEALLKEAGVGYFVADQNMSIVEGSIGILPRRILVKEDDLTEAEKIIRDAGIAEELKQA